MRLLYLAASSAVCLATAGLPSQGVDGALDPAVRAQVQALLDSANADHLPLAPLTNRILEARARHTPGARLVEVLRAHADSMRVVRTVLVDASAGELDAGASALRGGVGRTALQQVRGFRPAGGGEVALLVLLDLVRRGVPSEDAARAVRTVGAGQQDGVLLELQRDFAQRHDAEVRSSLDRIVRRLEPRPPPIRPLHDLPDAATHDPAWLSIGMAPQGAAAAVPDSRAHLAVGVPLPTLASWHLWTGGEVAPATERLTWRIGLEATRALWERRQFAFGVQSHLAVAQRGMRRDGLVPDTALTGDALRLPARAEGELHLTVDGVLPGGIALFGSVGGRYWSETVARYGQIGTVGQGPSDTLSAGGTSPLYGYRAARDARSALLTVAGVGWRRTALQLEGSWVPRLTGSMPGLVAQRAFSLGWRATQELTRSVALVAAYSPRPERTFWDAGDVGAARWRVGFRVPLTVARADTRTRPASPSFSYHAEPSGAAEWRVAVEVFAPDARRVELDGDLTQWAPMPLSADGADRFTGQFVATQGLWRVRIRIDGGPWLVPAGLPSVIDDFGGAVGVLSL